MVWDDDDDLGFRAPQLSSYNDAHGTEGGKGKLDGMKWAGVGMYGLKCLGCNGMGWDGMGRDGTGRDVVGRRMGE